MKRRTADGATPLYVAAQAGHAEVVRYLRGAGARADEALCTGGATPLIAAAQLGHTGCGTKPLLRKPCPPRARVPLHRRADGALQCVLALCLALTPAPASGPALCGHAGP